MRVSWRNIAVVAGLGVVGAVALTAVNAGAQTACCQAPPPPPPPQHSGCCAAPPNLVVSVPGVSVAATHVSVGASASAIAVAGVSTTLSSGVVVSGGGSANSTVFFSGGGRYSAPGVSSSTIRGLNVDAFETRTVVEDVTKTEEYCIDKEKEERQRRAVQALCIDDKNTPHPASRLDDKDGVAGNYKGEVYRCLAGSHMQVTYGAIKDGKPDFTAGETFSCRKGESLWHEPGGKLVCKTQTPERNCNERSLLRKYGPGVKIIEVSTTKKICEPATRQVMTKVSKQVKAPKVIAAGDLMLDGGVGSGVN